MYRPAAGAKKDAILNDRVKKDVLANRSRPKMYRPAAGAKKDAILNDRVKKDVLANRSRPKMSRPAAGTIQGRNIKYRVSCKDEGMSSGTGNCPKLLNKNSAWQDETSIK
jgi:hypothetical protein